MTFKSSDLEELQDYIFNLIVDEPATNTSKQRYYADPEAYFTYLRDENGNISSLIYMSDYNFTRINTDGYIIISIDIHKDDSGIYTAEIKKK